MIRLLAYRIWSEYLRTQTFLSRLMEQELRKAPVGERDRAFLFELLYGTCRRKLFLDTVIKRYARRKDLPSAALLQLAVYQVLFMGSVTDYAAVNETVDVAKKAGLSRQSGFVNAVLRRVVKDAEKLRNLSLKGNTKDTRRISEILSYPEWIVKRFQRQFGHEKADDILRAMNGPSSPSLYELDFSEEGLIRERGIRGLPLKKVRDLLSEKVSLPRQTLVISPAQLSAVRALDVRPGFKVLDLCSSPGGKARVMISCLRGSGTLVCTEKSIGKIRKEKQDLVGGSPFVAACGPNPKPFAQKVEQRGATLSVFFVCADAGQAGNMFPQEYFDRVMLDVPCSNSAEMSKRPEVRWRISPEDIKRLSLEQKRLLSSAAETVKKGGALVYSTCSLMQEENSSITGQFIKDAGEFTLEKEELSLPTASSPSGGYYARLVRAAG